MEKAGILETRRESPTLLNLCLLRLSLDDLLEFSFVGVGELAEIELRGAVKGGGVHGYGCW